MKTINTSQSTEDQQHYSTKNKEMIISMIKDWRTINPKYRTFKRFIEHVKLWMK